MNNPKVSIIVPVYNVEKYIHKCLDSIIKQTFTDFECIIVDDCSPDKCPEICDEYTKQDSRIKVIHKTKNEGLPYARKTGFENSCGDYILNIDSDDFIEFQMIEKLYLHAISNNYDMVYCDFFYYNISNNIIYIKTQLDPNNYILNIKHTIFELNRNGVVWNKIIKRTIYENLEFPKDMYAEDKYISTQILYFSKNIGYINEALYHYQYHQESLMNDPKLIYKRYFGLNNNYNKILSFLGNKVGIDVSVFEPELSKRLKFIKNMNPWYYKNFIKKLLRIDIPCKKWRIFIKNIFKTLFHAE